MSGKKERASERLRKSDKIIPDVHREYLDMDTDEEEFGRQESPEIKEEFPPEPEKPVYTEEDLNTLVSKIIHCLTTVTVEYVKNLVVFSSLEDSDWNEDCYEIIREFFRNPSYPILSIFYQQNKLTAILNLPHYAPRGFTYLSRSPWQIYTADNFFSSVLFGTINSNVVNCVLKIMETIYAPIALKSNDYSPRIPLQYIYLSISRNLHDFLMHLTDEVYKPMGLTVLYVPKEQLLKTFSKSSETIDCFLLGKDKETILTEDEQGKRKLISRLEKVVFHWIKKIREATKTMQIRRNIESILDEVNYWNALHFNLENLHAQISNADAQLIINLLRTFRSPSIELYEELAARIKRKLKESSSNLMYLNVLLNIDLKVPHEINDCVTKALLLILFIWSESPFYNSTDNIEILCRALGSQIIQKCKEYIDFEVAFESNPNEGIRMLERCIICCDTYRIIYDRLITNVAVRVNSNKNWDINEKEVFEKVDIFKQRCHDVIQICKAVIVFGRYNKVGLIGSPKGKEYEAYCRKMENVFYENLDEIIMVQDIIFNVKKSTWLRYIDKFRKIVTHLENLVKDLIDTIFNDVKNIDEGIEAIYALQKFKQTECLRELLQSKWAQVWNIFNDEVKFSYFVVTNKTKDDNQSVEYNDRKEDISCIMSYLKNQYIKMIDASDWIGDCATEKSTSQQNKRMLDVIDERRKNM